MVRQYTSCISKFHADTCTLSVPIFDSFEAFQWFSLHSCSSSLSLPFFQFFKPSAVPEKTNGEGSCGC